MPALSPREKVLIGTAAAVIFVIGNAFVARSILKSWRGGASAIALLENELADHQLWLEDAPDIEARRQWLAMTMPRINGATLGKLQGDLLQSLQDDVFNRKLKIEQQSLQDIVTTADYTEVAVRLTVRGDESEVVTWLTTLQSPEKFQVIKALELKIDEKAKEELPQAVCSITIARWFGPDLESVPPLTGSGDDTVSGQPNRGADNQDGV